MYWAQGVTNKILIINQEMKVKKQCHSMAKEAMEL